MANQAIIAQKAARVAEVQEKIQNAQSVVIVDYRGYTVEQDTELRTNFRKAGVEYAVIKNGILTRAAEAAGIDAAVAEYFKGPTAVAFGVEDPAAPAKIIKEFIKKTKKGAIKGGIVNGALQDGVMAKDVVLRAIGTVGHNGATYKAMEFCGTTFDAMSMDERLCVANMAVEAGAKNGLIPYDSITQAYLRELGVDGGWPCESDPDAVYCQDLHFDASALEPLCACPHEVDNVAPVRQVTDVAIHQAYLGSCTGGRYHDLAQAASLLRGRKIAKGIRLLVSPASREIWERCAREGILTTLSEAGATVLASSCGACLGIHSGAIGAGEVCVSATNRNFIGRMGSKQGQVYLASPLTVAASALTGRLTDPRDIC